MDALAVRTAMHERAQHRSDVITFGVERPDDARDAAHQPAAVSAYGVLEHGFVTLRALIDEIILDSTRVRLPHAFCEELRIVQLHDALRECPDIVEVHHEARLPARQEIRLAAVIEANDR
jgi:hypothetical protein